ncbi:FAD dependent oxidoreductase [Daedaleopsis nitida]|nr:FAD dependent oxidoreductase [Daedaleopsis nitida]
MTSSQNHNLVFWKDLSPYPICIIPSTVLSPRILIVGGGVTGLITAWVLLDKGYHVTVVAKEWASYGTAQRLTSQIAGALWEFPPAVCGQHTDAISLHHSKRWCMVSYHIWDAIAAVPQLAEAAGVRVKGVDFFFPFAVEEDPAQLEKMREIMASGVRGFHRDARLVQERNVSPTYGAVDAYEHLAPIIDTDRAMRWLMDLVQSKGGQLVTRTIHGDLLDQEMALRTEYEADAIVNATGLAGDYPRVEHALTISADVTNVNEIVFLVPRNDDVLIIGGITESNEWELDLTLESPIIQRMRARCEAFLPDLKKARLDPEYPLAQGLRPFREHNVRVERELRLSSGESGSEHSRIVHSYGQGGAGWSLSFGCAGDVLALVEEALLNRAPTPMAGEVKPVVPQYQARL